MREQKPETREETLDRIGSLYIAARIVVSDSKRATSEELKMAKDHVESAAVSLRTLGFIPEKAFMKTLPEGEAGHLKIITGQDGCIPEKDTDQYWLVPGEKIQTILSNLYSSWFHHLKRI